MSPCLGDRKTIVPSLIGVNFFSTSSLLLKGSSLNSGKSGINGIYGINWITETC